MAHTVLFVDDDPGILQAFVRRLRKEPYEILTAAAAEEALAVLARREAEVIVSDWRMPGMNGTELLTKVAELYPCCIRIMLTGEPSVAVAMAAINSGEVYRFLTKPYDVDALAAIIRDALRQREERCASASGPAATPAECDTGRGADEVFRESAGFKDSVVAGALDCIITTDNAGKVLEFNPAAERTFGYARAAVLGKLVADVFRPSGLRDLLTGGLTVIAPPGGEGELLGRRLETTAIRSDGTEVAVELVTITARNAGQPIFTSFVRDVSELRAAEMALKKTEAELRQAQKLEALGRLAGGVAHDFNNLLTVIGGYSELLLADPSLKVTTREAVKLIRAASERAAGLTRQLLAFSRKREVVAAAVDLNRLILDLDRMLRRLVGEHIELVTLTASEPVCVRADRGQLEQVVMNLIVNASDAMPGGGQLTVETAASPAASAAPTWVVLSVRDTGCGMDEATRARVFEPFFTTKDIGKGTGLGLSSVYGIVTDWGGHVELDTAPGRGTTFRVRLPRVEPERPGPQSAEDAPPAGSETVLVVEDEGAVRRLACTFLRTGGYQVLEASYPGEALEMIARSPGRIDLLVTDVVMPQMSGPRLAERYRAERPGGKVLLMSGYVDPRAVADTEFAEIHELLRKPFARGELLAKVRQVLDAPGPQPS